MVKARKNRNKTRREKIKRGRRATKTGVIADPGCEGIGECCKDRTIYLNPFDMWRIFNNQGARDKYNIVTSMDLYGKNGPLEYWIHPETNQLCCNIKSTVTGGRCRFYELGQCLLCKDRPTDCLSRPLLQWGSGLVLDTDSCATCDKREPAPNSLSVLAFLAQRDVVPGRMTEKGLFSIFEKKLHDLAITKGGDLDLHMLSTALVMLFDFDRLLLKTRLSPDEIARLRPRNAGELMAGVYTVMERTAHSAATIKEVNDAYKELSGQFKEREASASGGAGGGGEEKVPSA